ncbi:hypothetical protein [Actinocorallia libanotica]|uniref:hypothetical protein n=1 Tax=Actinocorallia libanotica TaxID=46162 RepID=UPI0031E22760
MSMRTAVEEIAVDTEEQLASGLWRLTDGDRAIAERLWTLLGRPADGSMSLAGRMLRLREALAVVAMAAALSRGQLARVLNRCAVVFSPLLQWRTEPVGLRVVPDVLIVHSDHVNDAEQALTRLRSLVATVKERA